MIFAVANGSASFRLGGNLRRTRADVLSASVSRPSFLHIIISYRPSVVAVFFGKL